VSLQLRCSDDYFVNIPADREIKSMKLNCKILTPVSPKIKSLGTNMFKGTYELLYIFNLVETS
jgi:hypothetical protein